MDYLKQNQVDISLSWQTKQHLEWTCIWSINDVPPLERPRTFMAWEKPSEQALWCVAQSMAHRKLVWHNQKAQRSADYKNIWWKTLPAWIFLAHCRDFRARASWPVAVLPWHLLNHPLPAGSCCGHGFLEWRWTEVVSDVLWMQCHLLLHLEISPGCCTGAKFWLWRLSIWSIEKCVSL